MELCIEIVYVFNKWKDEMSYCKTGIIFRIKCFPCCITIPMAQHQTEAGESKCTVIVLSLFVLLLANANLDHKLGNNVPKDWQSAGC